MECLVRNRHVNLRVYVLRTPFNLANVSFRDPSLKRPHASRGPDPHVQHDGKGGVDGNGLVLAPEVLGHDSARHPQTVVILLRACNEESKLMIVVTIHSSCKIKTFVSLDYT